MNAQLSIELPIPLGRVPYVENLLGVWAIEPSHLDGLVAIIQGMDIASHLQRQATLAGQVVPQARSGSAGGTGGGWYYTQLVDNVAIITASGTLQKHEASFSNSTSTVALRRDFRTAANHPDVGAILFAIDSSPGGTAAGQQELADEIEAAAKKKPILCHINDLGASAAYWSAVPCEKILANEAGLVGSIGTYAMISDMSGAAAQAGMKVHVVKYGSYKGMGTPGTEITPDQLAEMQRIVDSRQEFFTRAVAAGRKMTPAQVKDLADGRVHPASEALKLGLIDGIASFEQAFAQAKEMASQKTKPKGKPMSADTASTVVTTAAIKTACPGCSADFIVASLDAGRSLEDCRSAYMQAMLASAEQQTKAFESLKADIAKQTETIAGLQKEITELKASNDKLTAENAELAKRPEPKGGVKVLTEPTGTKSKSGTEATDGSASPYWAKVHDLMASDKMTRAQAMSYIGRHHPELRQEFAGA